MPRLPKSATAPFSPSEVQGSIPIPDDRSWRSAFRFAGPGLLISVGYMDPGNWATDIAAGVDHGYALLFVVVLSSLAAIGLQTLAMRLGAVAKRDLAQLSRDAFSPPVAFMLWLFAEISIIACDVAEVLGSALAFKLLFGMPLEWGILVTGLDTLLVLGLQGRGFRRVEAIILGLVATIGICFVVELALVGPDWGAVSRGLVPSFEAIEAPGALWIAVGIVGATIMPHNLYLHSSIIQTRRLISRGDATARTVRLATVDIVISLLLALFVNAAILILAAAAFGANGLAVESIEDAHRLLEPVAGSAVAPILFGIALLAAGQSSTFTGTIAGQVIMDGYLELRIPSWQRRLATRTLAIVPAYAGVTTMGDGSVGDLLVLTQVVLSAQLPFAMYPMIRFTSDRALMGRFATPRPVAAAAWAVFATISAANVWLVLDALGLAPSPAP
jgi:manganese transport protein